MFSPALDRSYWIHRWLGLILALPLLAWCLSGLAYLWIPGADESPASTHHTLAQPLAQSKVQSFPVHFLSAEEFANVSGLTLIAIEGVAYYQLEFIGEHGFRYYLAADGTRVTDGHQRHAAAIAGSQPVDGTVDFERIRPVHPAVRHLRLPSQREGAVFSVPFNNSDQLHRYVDTRSGRILGETTRSQRRMLSFIHYAHHMSWLGSEEAIHRRLIVAFASLTCAILGLAGLILYGVILKLKIAPSRPRRRLHRLLGVGLSLPLLAFGWSGFVKALDSNRGLHDQVLLSERRLDTHVSGPQLQRFLQNVSMGSFARLDIIRFEEGYFYRVFSQADGTGDAAPRIFNAATLGRVAQAEQRHAESLFRDALSLSNYSRPNTHSLQRIQQFSKEYPARYRVLPVYRGISNDSGFTERYPIFYLDTLGNRMVHLNTHAKRKNESRFERLHLFGLVSNYRVQTGLLILASTGLIVLLSTGVMNALRMKKRHHR
jgi:hypothetical protein